MSVKIIGHCPWVRPDDYECYKISYDTPQEAQATIDRKKKRRGQHDCRQYKCKKCNKFHITSENERVIK